MANIAGFRNLPQNKQSSGLPPSDKIPFMFACRSQYDPIKESILETLKIYVYPDWKVKSISTVLMVLIWLVYLIGIITGVDHNDLTGVFPINYDIITKFGVSE